MKRYSHIIFMMLLMAMPMMGKQYADSAVYQGINLKLDVGNAAMTLIQSKTQRQQYELAMNVNLQKRFFPTIELGTGWGTGSADLGAYEGAGAFGRIGMDINPLKKNRNNDYALLVGFRVGVSMQDYSLSGVTLTDSYWGNTQIDYPKQFRCDSWGEVVGGCQVKVVGPFSMGWYVRIHFLFTGKTGDHQPYWIPGYGFKDGASFSFNYYLGWKF